MEKIMIFSLALWLGLMFSAAPGRTINNTGTHRHTIAQKGNPDKPVKPHEHAVIVHSPE
ncbi:MAG: hypothetical protein WCJ26_15740 [bacterium]